MALGSDLVPNLYNQGLSIGALGTLADEDAVNNTVDLFKLKSASPVLEDDVSLQEIYGTEAMPVFDWVRAIQSGTRVYNPADQFDQQKSEEYGRLQRTNPNLPGIPGIGDLAMAVAPGLGGMIASGITDAAFDPLVKGMSGDRIGNVLSEYGKSILPKFMGGGSLPSAAMNDTTTAFLSGGGPDGITGLGKELGNNIFYPELASEASARASGNTQFYNAINDPRAGVPSQTVSGAKVYNAEALKNYKTAQQMNDTTIDSNIVSDGITSANINADQTYLSGVSDTLSSPSTWASAGIGALAQFGIGIMTGMDPVQAAKTAGATAIGSVLGAAVGGPLGGFIGGTLGGMVGGRVICNELQRQGLMTRKQIVLDYRFTRDYLSPTHVDGYHYWAIQVVRQLRQGKNVKLWKHIATHRVNEISYVYGERRNPDYLGKVYRHILEPVCWVIGKLKNKESDWSVLYHPKES